MAQTSIGFNGSISAVQWAQNAVLLLSNGYGVGGVTECAVTQVTGQRAVSVAAGRIGGDGIVTTLSAAETVTLPTPTNGQWYLLVLNRKWSDSSTSLLLRNGPTTAAASSGTVPASYPASMTTTPGTNADVAVAWLWANSSGTTVSIVPILRPHAATAPRRGTTTQRDALFSGTGSFAARKYLQDTAGQWFNTDTANYESYYAEYDATFNPAVSSTRTAGGWVRQDIHKGGVFYDVIAADGTTQIQHGLGVTPTDVQVTPMNHPSDDSISKYFTPILFNPPTSTRFTVRLLDRRSNDWASGQQRYRFQWHAFAAGQ